MFKFLLRYPLFVLAIVLISACPGFAANTGNRIATLITSSRMDYDATAQTVLFSGNVHVTRPDFELWSDKMTVYLEKSSKTQAVPESGGMEAGDIDRIVAEGSVRMHSDKKRGTCDKATYYSKNEHFVMEGSPELRDERQSVITGGTIVHNFATNHSEVLNASKVVFYTPDKKEGSNARGAATTPKKRAQ
ncbi:MAG: LptA/OstA family protein [Desulfovibrio sp.]|jgi:lipopolysaccharide export system protein LptA|nr:LptA/OstA family protein [Desulfovibrio sp.]